MNNHLGEEPPDADPSEGGSNDLHEPELDFNAIIQNLQSFQKQHSKQLKEHDETMAEKTKLSDELNDVRGKLEDMSGKLEDVRVERGFYRNAAERAYEKYEAIRKELSAEQSDAKARVEAERNKTKGVCKELETERNKTKGAYEELETERNKTKGAYEELETERSKADAQIEAARRKTKAREDEIMAMRNYFARFLGDGV